MRSRAARLILSATAWIGMGAAAFVLVTTERQVAERQSAGRTFDDQARRAADALADARAGQQAYVAAGQDAVHWMPRVATHLHDASDSVDALRSSATTDEARQALIEASATLTELNNIDQRARTYLRSSEPLMAGDVVFSEGDENARQAATRVEGARAAEAIALDAYQRGQRLWQAYALGAAAGWAVLVMAFMSFARGPARNATSDSNAPLTSAGTPDTPELTLRESRDAGRRQAEITQPLPGRQPSAPDAAAPETIGTLAATATLCTELSQVRDLADLEALLSRAVKLLDASGLVIWMRNAAGSELQAAVAHGYGESALALMKPVPRSADNAAAAAYRSGTLQVVVSRSGTSLGALAAPLLSADGCIGALTAEVKGGSETSAVTQAVATLLAAQLAAIVTAPASSTQDRVVSA